MFVQLCCLVMIVNPFSEQRRANRGELAGVSIALFVACGQCGCAILMRKMRDLHWALISYYYGMICLGVFGALTLYTYSD